LALAFFSLSGQWIGDQRRRARDSQPRFFSPVLVADSFLTGAPLSHDFDPDQGFLQFDRR
jgi:hypothetical protein